jgi:hypothetical protein
MDILTRIKQLVVRDAVRFTDKARDEMEVDLLSRSEVIESVLNAKRIEKTLRSTSPARKQSGDKLYVIKSSSYNGTKIYTKGKIDHEGDFEYLYILVSAKIEKDVR